MQLEGALQRPGNHACSDLAVIKFPLSKWENAFFKPNFAESIERVTKPVVRCRGVQENGFFAPVASESPEKPRIWPFGSLSLPESGTSVTDKLLLFGSIFGLTCGFDRIPYFAENSRWRMPPKGDLKLGLGIPCSNFARNLHSLALIDTSLWLQNLRIGLSFGCRGDICGANRA